VGSVYAGRLHRLSLRSGRQLAAALRRPVDSLVRRRGVGPRSTPASRVPGPEAVAGWPRAGRRLSDDVRTGTTVTALTLDGTRWRVSAGGSDDAAGNLAADAVVLATPAFVSAPLLAPVAPGPAAFLAGIDHASVALLGLAVPRDGIDHPMDGSGFLVPRSEGLVLTACSWATTSGCTWPSTRPMALLRVSRPRRRRPRPALPDHELVAAMPPTCARPWACGRARGRAHHPLAVLSQPRPGTWPPWRPPRQAPAVAPAGHHRGWSGAWHPACIRGPARRAGGKR
jgi:oxygen-dependent protoporphyrinogen oxidase